MSSYLLYEVRSFCKKKSLFLVQWNRVALPNGVPNPHTIASVPLQDKVRSILAMTLKYVAPSFRPSPGEYIMENL